MYALFIRQFWAFFILVLSILIGASLYSYNTGDPGWTHVLSPKIPTKNMLGAPGAWFADFSYSLLGYVALVVPIIFFCAACGVIAGAKRYICWYLPWATLCVFFSGTLLSSLHFANYIPLPVSSGGLLGLFFASIAESFMGTEFTTVFALLMFLHGCAILFRFSWMLLAETIGSIFFYPVKMACMFLPLVQKKSEIKTDKNTQLKRAISFFPDRKKILFWNFFPEYIFGKSQPKKLRKEPILGDIDEVDNSETAIKKRIDVQAFVDKAYLDAFGTPYISKNSNIDNISISDENFVNDKYRNPSDDNESVSQATDDRHENTIEVIMQDNKKIEVIEGKNQQEYGDVVDNQLEQQHTQPDIATGDVSDMDTSELSVDTHADSHNREQSDIYETENAANMQEISDNTHSFIPTVNTYISAAENFDEEGEIISFPDEDEKCYISEEVEKPSQNILLKNELKNDQENTIFISEPDTDKNIDVFQNNVQFPHSKKIIYSFPPVNLLFYGNADDQVHHDTTELQIKGKQLEQNLLDFGIKAQVVEIHPGPVITRYEIVPAPGVKVVRIANLVKDIARSMSVIAVRIVEVIHGKSTIGIEVPNQKRATVRLAKVIDSPQFDNTKIKLPIALGFDIQGKAVVAPLEKMPHLLVAGTTGSGKSVGVNAMLLSLLFKRTPEQLRLLLIDPKMLELSVYNGIPHLLAPVVTDMKDAANVLRWCVAEMDKRYLLMSKLGVRNVDGYNKRIEQASEPIPNPLSKDSDHPPALTKLPHIVVIIDEFADMMMIVGKKVEELIARIAQKARAAGIHMILATQRPSVDVITGLIKANVPTRIAFQVSSKIDSRTILDQSGAEQLLGQGDMLFMPPGQGTPQRVHGAFVSDDEVHRVVEYWKNQDGPAYIDNITQGPDEKEDSQDGDSPQQEEEDTLYASAVAFVIETQRVSISSVQRKFKIGYNRAARIIDTMEERSVVSPMETNGKREVLLQG